MGNMSISEKDLLRAYDELLSFVVEASRSVKSDRRVSFEDKASECFDTYFWGAKVFTEFPKKDHPIDEGSNVATYLMTDIDFIGRNCRIKLCLESDLSKWTLVPADFLKNDSLYTLSPPRSVPKTGSTNKAVDFVDKYREFYTDSQALLLEVEHLNEYRFIEDLPGKFHDTLGSLTSASIAFDSLDRGFPSYNNISSTLDSWEIGLSTIQELFSSLQKELALDVSDSTKLTLLSDELYSALQALRGVRPFDLDIDTREYIQYSLKKAFLLLLQGLPN